MSEEKQDVLKMIVVSTTGNLDFSHCGDYAERKSRHGEKNAQISIVT